MNILRGVARIAELFKHQRLAGLFHHCGMRHNIFKSFYACAVDPGRQGLLAHPAPVVRPQMQNAIVDFGIIMYLLPQLSTALPESLTPKAPL